MLLDFLQKMEPMDVDCVDPQWQISTDFHGGDDSILVDMDCSIHCVHDRPFVFVIEFNKATPPVESLSFMLIDKESNHNAIFRCCYHTNNDFMSKKEMKGFPLIIHEDLPEEYEVSYSMNGAATVSFPNNRRIHRVPIAFRCSNECLGKETSILVYSQLIGSSRSGKVANIHIYRSPEKFRKEITRIITAKISDSDFPKITQFLMQFSSPMTSNFIMKSLILLLLKGLKENIPGMMHVLNQAFSDARQATELVNILATQRYYQSHIVSTRTLEAASPKSTASLESADSSEYESYED